MLYLSKELLHRTLALLEENRAAARRFYQYTSRKLDLQSNVHFMLLILRCLRNHLLNQQAQVGQQESGQLDGYMLCLDNVLLETSLN